MAGAGYKLFNTGDVLTAAQVNTYLQEQTVMVFASSTARTTALSGVLAEGMVSYLQDTNAVEVYNGTAWVGVSGTGDVTEVQAGTGISVASGTGPIPVVTNTMATAINAAGDLIYGTGNDAFTRLALGTAGQVLKVNSGATAPEWAAAGGASGLTLISRTSFSNVAGQNFDDVFSSTYNAYKVIIEVIYAGTTSDTLRFQVRTSGTTQTTGYYGSVGMINTASTAFGGAANSSNAASLQLNYANIGDNTSGASTGLSFDIVRVGSNNYYKLFGNGYASENGHVLWFAGFRFAQETVTGFRLFGSTSNVTGTVAIYGYGA